jgi:hypothetical protein
MDVSGIATMYLVNSRFRQLIRGNSHIFLRKPIARNPVYLNINRQPPQELYNFFMLFGDQMSALVIDNLCMTVATHIVGFSPQLRCLKFKTANILALHFLTENMSQRLSVLIIP